MMTFHEFDDNSSANSEILQIPPCNERGMYKMWRIIGVWSFKDKTRSLKFSLVLNDRLDKNKYQHATTQEEKNR